MFYLPTAELGRRPVLGSSVDLGHVLMTSLNSCPWCHHNITDEEIMLGWSLLANSTRCGAPGHGVSGLLLLQSATLFSGLKFFRHYRASFILWYHMLNFNQLRLCFLQHPLPKVPPGFCPGAVIRALAAAQSCAWFHASQRSHWSRGASQREVPAAVANRPVPRAGCRPVSCRPRSQRTNNQVLCGCLATGGGLRSRRLARCSI